MSAPFGRCGGKSRSAKYIIPLFPNDYTLYVEPFFGAGNIFFRLPEDKKTNPMIINDLDDDIFIAMNGLKDNAEHIQNNIRRGIITKDEWYELLDKKDAISVIEKIKFSFFSRAEYYNKNCNKGYNSSIKTDFLKYGPLLKNTIILNDDYKKVIADYDGKDTFFYLDPPYANTSKKHYKYNSIEATAILDILRTIKGRFIMSYNNTEDTRNIFSEFHQCTISTSYMKTHIANIPARKKVDELVISNFPLE
jgi:DNA adenine methylase